MQKRRVIGEVGKLKCLVEEGNEKREGHRGEKKRRDLLLSRSRDNSPADCDPVS